ncbi:DUF2730 family protein [Desulfovibrio porci]|uniref:DUF2730 family protein n=1 Tax=Desulfovibrio porci TaxID=2605782 RepID=UPI003A91590F
MTESLPAMIWDYLPGVLQGLTTGLVAWGWWSLKRVFVSRADFDVRRAATDARLDAIESRQYSRTTALQQIDFKLDALPTSDEVRGLAISLKEMEGDLKGIRAQVEGLSHATARLERAVDMFTEVHMEKN